MRAGVPLEVERVVEALAAERAEVALDVRVALHVPVEQPLEREALRAEAARELGRVVRVGAAARRGARRAPLARLARPRRAVRLRAVPRRVLALGAHPVVHERVLDAVAAVHELERRVARQSQLQGDFLSMSKTRPILKHFNLSAPFLGGSRRCVI